MCKSCGCGLTNKKNPMFGKGPMKGSKTAPKKAAPKKKK